jgi:hypothetical protein
MNATDNPALVKIERLLNEVEATLFALSEDHDESCACGLCLGLMHVWSAVNHLAQKGACQ